MHELSSAAGKRDMTEIDEPAVCGGRDPFGHSNCVGNYRVPIPEPVTIAFLSKDQVHAPRGDGLDRSDGDCCWVAHRARKPWFQRHGGGGVLVYVPYHRRKVEAGKYEQQLGVVQQNYIVVAPPEAQQLTGAAESRQALTSNSPRQISGLEPNRPGLPGQPVSSERSGVGDPPTGVEQRTNLPVPDSSIVGMVHNSDDQGAAHGQTLAVDSTRLGVETAARYAWHTSSEGPSILRMPSSIQRARLHMLSTVARE